MSVNLRAVSQTPSPLKTPLGMAVYDKTLFDQYSSDECYARIGEYLNEHNIPYGIIKDFDFKKNLAPNTHPLYKEACQVRARGTDPHRVEAYAERFKGGEKVKYPPILFPTSSGRAVTAAGNHRVRALEMADVKSAAIVIDTSGYDSDERVALARCIATITNGAGQYSREEDSMEDVIIQLFRAYRTMMSVNPQSQVSFTKDDRKWRSRISAASDPAVEDALKREWFTEWMDREKPYSFKATRTRGRIFNQVFTSASGMYMTPADHYTTEALQDVFKDKFPNSTWDPDENQLSTANDIHQMEVNWTKEPSQHIRRTLKDMVFLLELPVSQTKEAWLVIWGSPHTTTVETRERHITSLMATLKRDNLNFRTARSGDAVVTKVLFPQAVACDTDDHLAYMWNTQNKEFDKV